VAVPPDFATPVAATGEHIAQRLKHAEKYLALIGKEYEKAQLQVERLRVALDAIHSSELTCPQLSFT